MSTSPIYAQVLIGLAFFRLCVGNRSSYEFMNVVVLSYLEDIILLWSSLTSGS